MDWTLMVKFLWVWFFLALILEEAAGFVFNSRAFQKYLTGRGLKSIFILAGGLAITLGLKIDLLHMGLVAVKMKSQVPTEVGYIITALLLAGGSGSVFRALNKMREFKKEIDKTT